MITSPGKISILSGKIKKNWSRFQNISKPLRQAGLIRERPGPNQAKSVTSIHCFIPDDMLGAIVQLSSIFFDLLNSMIYDLR